jgi:hypothetical protein
MTGKPATHQVGLFITMHAYGRPLVIGPPRWPGKITP